MNDFFDGFDAHSHGGHGDEGMHFSFEGGHGGFDFDDMFSDDDGDEFFGGNSFMNMEFGDDPWEMENQFDDGHGFDSMHHAQHMHSHQNSHKQATHTHTHSSSSSEYIILYRVHHIVLVHHIL